MPLPVLAKSWLFEVVDRNTQAIEASFTLIFPPSQLTIREGQRVRVTKTFGGVFVDDYGPDNLEITLQGISGTVDVFPTFQTGGESIFDASWNEFRVTNAVLPGATTGYTGQEAFYAFRNSIVRYKDRANQYADKELRVYDLGDQQAYKCVLLDFTLSRDSAQPLRYQYRISLFVYEKSDSRPPPKLDKIQLVSTLTPSLLQSVLKKATAAKSALQKIRSGLRRYTKLAEDAADGVRNAAQRIYNATFGEVASTIDALTDAVGATGGFAKSVASQRRTLTDFSGLASSAESLVDATRDALVSIVDLVGQGNVATLFVASAMEQGTALWNDTKEAFANLKNDVAVRIGVPVDAGPPEETPEPAVARSIAATRAASPQATVLAGDYGSFRPHVVGSGETLQSVALAEMGDASLWPILAAVNDVTGNDELAPGQTLYVPVESTQTVSTPVSEYILVGCGPSQGAVPISSPYGTDIRLVDGDVVIGEGSDFRTVSGLENVIQSANLRLSTPLGMLIKHTAYGLRSQVGRPGNALANSYLTMAFRTALLQDPRIASVSNIRATFDATMLTVRALIQVRGASANLPLSVVL